MTKKTLAEMIADLDARINEMNDKRTELMKLEQEFIAVQKSYFGITEGEKANIYDLVKAIVLIKETA